jgi:uncharacterized protein
MPLFALSAHDVDTAGSPVDGALPTAWLDKELEDAALTAERPGHVTARISRSGSDIVVRGKATADLTTPCARCLDPAHLHVEGELSLLLRPVAEARAEAHVHGGHGNRHHANGDAKAAAKEKDRDDEYEFGGAEAEADVYDGETVVLDPFIREALLLEIPKFPLCSEACPGIRPADGRAPAEPAPAIDPRLAPLDALRKKLAGKAASPASPKAPAAPSPRTKKKNKE